MISIISVDEANSRGLVGFYVVSKYNLEVIAAILAQKKKLQFKGKTYNPHYRANCIVYWYENSGEHGNKYKNAP